MTPRTPAMKLGYIDYLNCFPFYYHMLEQQPLDHVDVISGYPSTLNRMMLEGELDMSPISAATCADINDEILVLPDFCLSSVGYVSSVLLISRLPIHALHHKKIGVTTASHTSIVLLKILMNRYIQVEPEYIPIDPMPRLDGLDAALVIGNEAMTVHADSSRFTYDLGELWLDKTGFPVVFAVFAVRKKSIDRYAAEIKNVMASYHRSLNCLSNDRNALIESAGKTYPEVSRDIDAYYNLLQFEFSDHLKQALVFYYNLSGELGLTKKVAQIDYYHA